jgi:hypothetical protein
MNYKAFRIEGEAYIVDKNASIGLGDIYVEDGEFPTVHQSASDLNQEEKSNKYKVIATTNRAFYTLPNLHTETVVGIINIYHPAKRDIESITYVAIEWDRNKGWGSVYYTHEQVLAKLPKGYVRLLAKWVKDDYEARYNYIINKISEG